MTINFRGVVSEPIPITVSQDTTTSIIDIEKRKEDDQIHNLMIFPNPMQNDMSISFDVYEQKNIIANIFDVLGRNVHNETFETQLLHNQKDISVSKLEAGIYFLTMSTDKSTKTVKFVKK